MKTPSSPVLLGLALLAVAGILLFASRRALSTGPDSPPPATTIPGLAVRREPARSADGTKPSEVLPLTLGQEGIPEFSNYDRDGDGTPEIGSYLDVYRRLDTSAGKIDMLDNVRTFDTRDVPELNDLLIEQAARANDPAVRAAAREALFEHGDTKAHDALAAYLKSETRAADVGELEKLLEVLQRKPFSLVRSGKRAGPTLPPHPNNNQPNNQ